MNDSERKRRGERLEKSRKRVALRSDFGERVTKGKRRGGFKDLLLFQNNRCGNFPDSPPQEKGNNL